MSYQAANKGDRPTTIYGAGLIWFPDWRVRATYDALTFYAEWRDRYAERAKVEVFDLYKPWFSGDIPPFLLNPGSAWKGRAGQDDKVLSMERTGLLYVIVYHYGGRPARARVKRRPTAEAPADPNG
jgi:hypothetical protein